ncbi:uncharacterized protein LOC136078737 [Hydra vulgaris]|uniref:Uncharacterized protein LOC136078737 n=1 Tax=Hydra vulgaris TaxID=6087 RepID=A0ABM4BND4_HYDVU
MDGIKENDKRKLIGNFYLDNIDKGKTFTVHHFMQMKVSRRTIYIIIKRVDGNIDLKRKSGSGRKSYKMDIRKITSLINKAENKVGISQRKLALKYGIHRSYVYKIFNMHGPKYFKRKKAPESSEIQIVKQKQRLLKLLKTFFRPSNEFEIITDDESYFTLNSQSTPGNDCFYSQDKDKTENNIKYKFKSKFQAKDLAWVAISFEF